MKRTGSVRLSRGYAALAMSCGVAPLLPSLAGGDDGMHRPVRGSFALDE